MNGARTDRWVLVARFVVEPVELFSPRWNPKTVKHRDEDTRLLPLMLHDEYLVDHFQKV